MRDMYFGNHLTQFISLLCSLNASCNTVADALNLTVISPCVSNYDSGLWWLNQFREAFRNTTGREPRMDHMCKVFTLKIFSKLYVILPPFVLRILSDSNKIQC